MSILSSNILTMLGEQYRHETANSLRYYQRASFADYIGLPSVAALFKREAEGERGHADRIYAYVADKSLILPITGLAFDEPDFQSDSDILGIFSSALAVELDTSARLERIVATARAESDTMTEQWLMDKDGLIREQIEEENLYQTILDHIALMARSPSIYHDIDSFIRCHFLG